jgi:hypothetical protein
MRQWARLRNAGLPGVLLASTAGFIAIVHQQVPLQSWLFFRYAACWLFVAVFAAAGLALGHWLVRPLAPALPLLEHLTLAFAAGVLGFATLVFLAGIAGLLNGPFFVALPLAALVLPGRRALRELWPELLRAIARARATPGSGLTRVIVTCGVLGVLLVYLPILSPENVAYDSRWYHLAIAEHYAAEQAIRRFPEGLLAGSYPQTATLLYTWAFSSPFGGLFDRVELAAHLEFALFLATLAGIPALVARLLPSCRAGSSWVALFLFPGIFVYDSELSCAADHVAALFAVPIFLALLRAWPAPSVRSCTLLAICVSGALSVKYTAASLVLGPSAALLARVLWLSVRSRTRTDAVALLAGLAAFAAVVLVATAPHWLKNWVFYGDPVYPLLADQFHPRPWAAHASDWQRTFHASQLGIPGRAPIQGVADVLYVLLTFSVVIHDFPHFHADLPVFGSLFSVATLLLPFLKGARVLVGPTLATYAGLVLWALLNAQDRYLQALLPWMVVVTAATLTLAWQAGFVARLAVGLAVGVQALWGASACFLPSHAMTRKPPIGATIELLGRRALSPSYSLVPFQPWPTIGNMLGPGARLLLHEGDLHLGVGVPTVLDTIPFMYGIDYGAARSCHDVYDSLLGMGVTHVLWQPTSHGYDSFAGDLVSLSCFHQHTQRIGTFIPLMLAKLPRVAPPRVPFGRVVVLSCPSSPYAPGIYELPDLAVAPMPDDSISRYPKPRVGWDTLDEAARSAALAHANLVVAEQGCASYAPVEAAGLVHVGQRGQAALYARPSAGAVPAGP